MERALFIQMILFSIIVRLIVIRTVTKSINCIYWHSVILTHWKPEQIGEMWNNNSLFIYITNPDEFEYHHEVNRLVSGCDSNNLLLNALKTQEMGEENSNCSHYY